MFSTIHERYNYLINARGAQLSLRDVVENARRIKNDRQQLHAELQSINDRQIESLSRKRVVEFVSTCKESENFFNEIENIRFQTQSELTEQFERESTAWNDILDNAEQHFLLLLKECLSTETIRLGAYKNENGTENAIEWTVLSVEPTLSEVHLLSSTPIVPHPFHEKGYTVVEDEDVFGCAEVACSWKESDIRAFLHGVFYNNAFSDDEKEYIIPQRRNYNADDFLIPNDVTEDCVYLLTLDEFLLLTPETQCCEGTQEDEMWWLGEQKKRGWDDTCELPKLYAVNCKSGKLTEATPDKMLLPRVGMAVSLDYLLSLSTDVKLW
mgnify:CR=1 FL=1